MLEYHEKYPQYGFNSHKGYLTKAHREALKKYGPSPIHRKTYAPIRELLVGKDNEQIEMFDDYV